MIDRRGFLRIGLRAAALAAWLGLAPGRARAAAQAPALPEEPPVVLELVRRSRPVSEGLSLPEAKVLLDEVLGPLTGSDDWPLEIWSELFPETGFVGVKIDAAAPGTIVADLARAIAVRAVEADVPADRVVIWDRAAEPLAAAGLAVTDAEGAVPRVASIGSAGGYGRPVAPAKGGEAAQGGARLARLAETITRHVTVTALSARPDGSMAPFAIENLAGAAAKGPKNAPPAGAEAARVVSDPALLPRCALHVADLWDIPLGRGGDGQARSYPAGTLLVSRDAVALTRVAHQILTATRGAFGLKAVPEPAALVEAARLGLGAAGLNGIRWRKMSF